MSKNKKITLIDLDETFFKMLKDGKFCLVLGAGFSYGLKNKTNSEFEDEKFIPIVKDFVSLTNRKFKTSFSNDNFSMAADEWQRKIANRKVEFLEFMNLFLVDEIEFNKSKRKLYSNILVPNWSRIYTFNFDNVLDILTESKKDEYEIQNHDVGSFSSANKIGIGYLHNSITKAKNIKDLVFTNTQYAEKIFKSDNHLYFSLLNDIEKHGKNLLIIGCGFVEQSMYTYLHSRIKRPNLKIIHINFSDKPNYDLDFEKKVKDISWINCKAEQFLTFLSNNLEKVSKQDLLPKFLEQLKEPQNRLVIRNLPVNSFHDFLDSQYLNYYSRDQFKLNLQDKIKKEFLNEDDFLKYIIEENYFGLIIHGQGGIGKTRLMLELGKKLFFQEFIVIKIHTEFENFDELVKYLYLRSEKKYLLLFDYIEEQKIFYKTVKWVTSNKLDNIRIIGNCRNTFVSDIQNVFSEHFKFIDIGFKNKIGLEQKLERDYNKKVILSIINSIPEGKLVESLEKDYILKTFYQARPSFAAFIKYLHLKNPQTDLSIVNNETFSNWLIKKLKLSIVGEISYSNFYEKKKYIFQILSCLPANIDAVSKLEKIKEDNLSFANEINKLINDGWIDQTDQYLKVVHDTVNDSLLLEFFKHFQFRDFYITDFLEFALETNNISSMLWSIQRIWNDFPINVILSLQKSIARFINSNLNENIIGESWFKYKLDTTHLITEEDRINLIFKYRNLLKDNFALEKFGSSLAFSMEWVHENILDDLTKKKYSYQLYELFFNEWNIDNRFDDFVEDVRGGKILSSYINLFGLDEYIKDRFYEYITIVDCNENNLEQISLALVSWLNVGGEVTKNTEEIIKLWFEVYGKNQPENINPQYLIKSCLYKRLASLLEYKLIKLSVYNLNSISHNLILALQIEEVISEDLKRIVCSWFEIYEKEKPENINPTQLAFTWIDKGGDIKIIENTIVKWIEKHKRVKATGYIIQSWIENGGNIDIIKTSVVEWIKIFREDKDASFLIQSWIKNGGDLEIIKINIAKWIKMFQEDKDANFVIRKWIEKNGDINIIKTSVVNWIKKFEEYEDARFVIKPWIEKGNDTDIIKTTVVKWVEKFGEEFDAKHVILPWIEKGGDINIIKKSIVKWIEKFQEDKDTGFLIRQWIEKGGDLIIIKTNVVKWIEIFYDDIEARFLINLWIKKGDDIEIIKTSVIKWIERFKDHEDARFVIKSWIENGGDIDIIKTSVIEWIEKFQYHEEARFVIKLWIERGDDIEIIEKSVVTWVTKYQEMKEASFVIRPWIKKGGDIDIIKKSLLTWLNKFLLDELNSCFVISAALENTKGYIIVHDKALEWFSHFGKSVNAKFPLGSWLNFSGKESTKEIEVWIIYWVENFYNPDISTWRDILLLNFYNNNKLS